MNFLSVSLLCVGFFKVFVEAKGHGSCLHLAAPISTQLNSHFLLGNGFLGDVLGESQDFSATFSY